MSFQGSQHEQPWVSPLAPSDSRTWPDGRSKAYWLGPFDLYRNRDAKAASQNTSPEAPEVQRLRRLADVQQSEGDHIGARFSLAKIMERYISDLEHISRWTVGFQENMKKRGILTHGIQTTVGGIINSYFTQCPELSDVPQDQDDDLKSWLKPFYDAVEKESHFEDPGVLYTTRVILCYAANQLYESDREWICKKYRQVLSCTERIFGSQHPDIISLLQGSAQAIEKREMEAYWSQCNQEQIRHLGEKELEKHRLQSMTRWKGEIKALLSRALSGLRKVHGYTAPPTLDCAYKIAEFHRRCGEADAAESTLREMCEITEQELGEEHDETLRFKAKLSSLLLEQNRFGDAGLNIHKYISEHWEAIQNESIEPRKFTLDGKHTNKRGWGAIISLNEQLSRHQAPLHFAWADHNLYTLPVHSVKLIPVFPSESQKDCAWRFSRRALEVGSDSQIPTHDAEANALMFQSNVNSDLSVDLRVPYIPYSHFMGTASFEQDESYLEYAKAAKDSGVSRSIHKEAEANTPIKISESRGGLEPDSVEENKEVMDSEDYWNLNVSNYSLYPEVLHD